MYVYKRSIWYFIMAHMQHHMALLPTVELTHSGVGLCSDSKRVVYAGDIVSPSTHWRECNVILHRAQFIN